MQPDYAFVAIGIAILLGAVAVALRGIRGRRPRASLASLFWALFGAGLLVQGFAPRLRIEKNAFVVPESMAPKGRPLDPVTIVNRERQMQTLSAVLVLFGAAGLAWHYRRTLIAQRSPPGGPQIGN